MSNNKMGIGIIGAGEIASAYCPAIKHLDNAELLMVMDKRLDQAKRTGEYFGVPFTDDIDDVLKNDRIEAVIIAVPHYLHRPLTLQAAEAGKHVMCDKPMATTRDDARAMMEVCSKAGVKLGINLASRCHPWATKAKELFASRIIGDIYFTKITSYSRKPDHYWQTGWMEGGDTSWRASKEKSGGGIGIMNMTHEIDRMRFATGLEVVHVKGESGNFMSPGVEVEDLVTGVFRYNNGAIGMVAASSHTLGNGPHEPTRVFGTQGQILLWNPIKVFTTREDTEFAPNEWHEVKCESLENNYIPYIHDFVEAVREDKEPPITGQDGFRVLDIVLGMYESSEKNQVVEMDLTDYR